jgi:UDP-glucose:(heptosyl)LPS alpha-1,3-glucosyltransferase
VIYSSIDWKEIGDTFNSKSAIAGELCKKHSINPKWNCLLFLGSGFSRKGLDIAIEGLLAVPESYHLLVVGKGAKHAYLHRASKLGLSHRVHFLGAQEKGWKYASVSRALVLPSRYDPFPGAAAEGHAMGLPVLVSDKNGYADWVVNGKNGIVLQSPMTMDNILDAFAQLLRLIEKPQMTAAQIRAHARNVDNDVILNKLLTEFLEIQP